MKEPIVLDFDRDSRLYRFQATDKWSNWMHRGFFARFSVQTLKNLRAAGDKQVVDLNLKVYVSDR
jgi:hypothetical protein